MHILVELDGVLRNTDDQIIPVGIIMASTLTVHNQLTYMSSMTRVETERWLNVNKIVDFDDVIDKTVALAGEGLQERQLNYARSRGAVDLFMTGNPTLWAYAFNLGIPCVMFAQPSYLRPEFRPDAPKSIRSWSDIEKAVEKQNELRTTDRRLTRTETLNFE